MSLDEYRIAEWLKVQLRLTEAERTGRGVVVTTPAGVTGPAVVHASGRGMVSLRSGREVWTLRLTEIESVIWAPPVQPEPIR